MVEKAGTLIFNSGVLLINNTANELAGAIYNGQFGTLTTNEARFRSNYASGPGSAVYNERNLTLSSGGVQDNKTAIKVLSGTLVG